VTEYYPHTRDRWLYPLRELEASAANLPLYRGAGTSDPVTATLAGVRTYYAVTLPYNPIPAANRLFPLLALALQNALASGTVTITPQAPASDGDIGSERLVITWTGGEWALRPAADPTSAIVAGWLGLDPTATVVRSDAAGVIRCPWSYAGAWYSDSLVGQGAALLKAPNSIRDVGYSSSRLWEAAAVVWGEQRVRTIRYEYVPAARVWRGRSLDPRRAQLAHLEVGDPNATFEPVWRALTNTSGPAVYIEHDLPVGVALSQVGDVERVTTWQPIPEYGRLIRDQGVAGDYYAIELAVRIDPAQAEYPL
jgi:hypothetical protein